MGTGKQKKEPWYIWTAGIGMVMLLIAGFLFWKSWSDAKDLNRVPERITLSALLSRGSASDIRVTITDFQIGPVSTSVGKANQAPSGTYFAIAPLNPLNGNAPKAVIVSFNRGLSREQILEIAREQALTGTFDFERNVSGASANMLKENYPDADPTHTPFLTVNTNNAKTLSLVAWLVCIPGAILFVVGMVRGMMDPDKKSRRRDDDDDDDLPPRLRKRRKEEEDDDEEPRGRKRDDNDEPPRRRKLDDDGEDGPRSRRKRDDDEDVEERRPRRRSRDDDDDDEPPRRRRR